MEQERGTGETAIRQARCRCGALTVSCEGEPVRVSVCHCFDCQQRSGSAFAAQARFPAERVRIEGRYKSWAHTGDSGRETIFNFCPECGSTLFYRARDADPLIAVAIGNFTDPDFPSPKFSVWEERKHPWVAVLGDEVEHVE